MVELTISAEMTNEMQYRLEKDDGSNGNVENDMLVDGEKFAKSC